MFGIGTQELLIIIIVALIFFGPKRLPDLAKSLGKGIAEFKKASEEVRQGIEEAMKEETKPDSVSEASPKEAPGAESAQKAAPDPYEAAKGDPPPESPASGAQGPPTRPG